MQIRADGSPVLMRSSPTTFGMDGSGPNDDPTLFDGGNGFAESILFWLDQSVFFESVLISQFGSDDSGRLEIKSSAPPISLANGSNNVGLFASKGSAHYLRWTGANVPGMGRGFSVDGFSVRLIGTVPVQSGDYNNNGVVDAADYVVWRKTLGNSITPFGGADGDGDGTVNAGDYSEWRENLGEVAGSGSAPSAVPETSTMFLFAAGAAAVLASRCRHAWRVHAR